jgi:hypothetical protein
VPEEDFGELTPAHGERDPSRMPELEGLPLDALEPTELPRTVRTLTPSARRELYVLMRIGKGDFAEGDWDRALADSNSLTDDTIAGAIVENPDLHDHLMKALYELRRI